MLLNKKDYQKAAETFERLVNLKTDKETTRKLAYCYTFFDIKKSVELMD